jgi:hypothetical protein
MVMEHLTDREMLPLTLRAVKTMKEKLHNPKWQRIVADPKLRFNETINEQERWLRRVNLATVFRLVSY